MKLAAIFAEIIVYPFTIETAGIILLMLLLLAITGFIAASEVAFFALNPHDINEINKKNYTSDNILLSLKEQSEQLLATILIANNTINVAVVILSTLLVNHLFDFSAAPWVGFLVQTIVITFLLLLIGEIGPKIYARQNALRFSRFSAATLRFLVKLLNPLALMLVKSTGLVDKRLARHNNQNLSIDELSQALELTTKNDDDDKQILEGIIKFGSKSVEEVMTARINITAIDIKSLFSEVKQQIIQSGYSRIPVFQGNIDTIKGILYNKDLLAHLDKSDTFKWQTLIRQPYFVPEKKKIDDLLREFQANKNHLAVVVDEYGGTSGIVTLEDILEEVVGEIDDEYDDSELLYNIVNEHIIDFDAKISLTDFFKVSKIEENDFAFIIAEADSLAGLILELTGELPHKEERIVFGGYTFEILDVDERRIIKIRLILPDEVKPA
ncbi:MAG: gliding motility-associated protein GldE [Bacteroidetes bacterium]|nr:gliding motility-associated protein GldE [Bacteroidota bacterium]